VPQIGLDDTSSGLDTKLLANLIYELNIARRHLITYPRGHPVVAATLQKVLFLTGGIFEISDEITLGVAKDTLMLGAEFLDRNNPVFRDFARCLFSHSVAALILKQGVTLAELVKFNEIISQKPDVIAEQGGIARQCADGDLQHIAVRTFDYNVFLVTECQSAGATTDGLVALRSDALWQRFVTGILEGNLDPQAEHSPSGEDFDPELLAEVLNGRYLERPGETEESYAKAITEYMRRLDREEVALGAETMEKLNRFVKSLNADLRKRFLSTSCIAAGERPDLVTTILDKFPDEVILDALQESISHESYLPPVILTVFQRLSKAVGDVQQGDGEKSLQGIPMDELAQRLHVIFREDDLDKFVPSDYQANLNWILATEGLSAPELSEIEDLKRTLTSHCVEVQVASVILDIMEGADTDPAGLLAKTLEEHCRYFSETGDFDTLLTIHNKMSGQRDRDPVVDVAVQEQILAWFVHPEFIQSTLDSPAIWGKVKIPAISALINRIGRVFIEPLLNRLAEEENMFLRRFCMDRLMELGPPVLDEVLQRLCDSRWYFVRNLLIILRNLDDNSVLPHVRAIAGHTHPRVRQELIKTLLHYRDPDGDALLLQELKDNDPERCLHAVRIAGRSQHPEVQQLLVGILQKKGFTAVEFEARTAAVHALAEIGDPSAVQALDVVLRSKSIFHPHMLSTLKAEIVTTLNRYPSEAAARLLRSIAAGGNTKLASLAATSLRSLWSRKKRDD
jgi:HEAT repeats